MGHSTKKGCWMECVKKRPRIKIKVKLPETKFKIFESEYRGKVKINFKRNCKT